MNITTAPAADLPPLSEMIMTAIETLTNEADKSTIQKHIESTYASLPSDFQDSFSDQLHVLTQTGQLTVVNDCYKKVDSDAPPPLRRGRGRPPKAAGTVKTPLVSANGMSPARPRGRPPKVRDPLASSPVKPAASASGRKRGRPPKANRAAPAAKKAAPPASGERRGRGRPPKVRTPVVLPIGS
ncbi:chromatin/chromatin-binding, or -regulatory protein [Lithospermum erythrorhizon]|uniref:Chromatin/chromatin-binding, or -regulatory protein n=1 Tax=Lithospermum erythrorhizon TaxID=34254 RepID=A0AAV3QFM5_LITER